MIIGTIYILSYTLVIPEMYRIPRLLDTNARSRVFRDKDKLLIIGRCIEIEHPGILENYLEEYGVLSVCPEAEHVNMVGFKLAGILARNRFRELTVLTVDGSLHCTQLHWMVEEVCKITGCEGIKRRHLVIYKGRVYEISLKTVKTSRYLYHVNRLIEGREA